MLIVESAKDIMNYSTAFTVKSIAGEYRVIIYKNSESMSGKSCFFVSEVHEFHLRKKQAVENSFIFISLLLSFRSRFHY